MTQPASASEEHHLVLYRNPWMLGNMNHDFLRADLTASLSKTMEHENARTLLKRICHLLESRAQREDEQQYEAAKRRNADDKKNKMKFDWMLAAAVIDRISAVAVTVIFVVGNVVFFSVFAKPN